MSSFSTQKCYKFRVPNSVLQVAAAIEHQFSWTLVDGNREHDPYQKLKNHLDTGLFKYIGFSVMLPGPQLQQAIPLPKK